MNETNIKISDLSAERIMSHIGSCSDISTISVLETVDSTNTYAKKLAASGAKSGTVVIANHQTAGRGRLGRSFYSPESTGLYMSLLIRNEHAPLDPSALTIAAGVAVCRAINTVCGKTPQIKWVNDIFLDSKKVCGILAEAGTDSGVLSYIIVGIGLNVSTQIFPGELQSIAASLGENINRSVIAGEIIKEFYELRPLCGTQELINEYKSLSLILGKKITFTQDGTEYCGIASDINIEGNLLVRLDNSKTVTLQSGMISLGSGNFTNI